MNTGKYVNPTDALFEIVNNSDLMVELNIFEKDLAGVSAGGFTEVILPEKTSNKNTGIVIKGAYNLLAAKKNAGEMSC